MGRIGSDQTRQIKLRAAVAVAVVVVVVGRVSTLNAARHDAVRHHVAAVVVVAVVGGSGDGCSNSRCD